MKRKRKLWGLTAAVLIFVLMLSGCGNSAGADSGMKGGATESQSGGAAPGQGMSFGSDGSAAESGENAAADMAESGTDSGAGAQDPAEGGEDAGILTGEEAGSAYEQKLIRTVNMSVETKAFDSLVENVRARTESLGGYVENSEVSGSAGAANDRWAYLTLRIPAQQLDAFLDQVSEEANVTYSSESTEDVTLAYTDMQSHVAALRTEQETLLSMLGQAQSMEDILAIQTQLTQVRYEIESYESQLRVYDNQVDYSTVYLDIREVARETSAEGNSFGERVRTRFGDTAYRVGQGFVNFAVGFLGALPVLIIVAVIAAAAVLVWKKVRKRKKKNKDRSSGQMDGEEQKEKSR